MHELPFTKEVLRYALEAGEANSVSVIHHIYIETGPLSDISQKWINRYFHIISKGTCAKGAKVHVSKQDFKARCISCGKEFTFPAPVHSKPACPECGSTDNRLLDNSEMRITHMEAE
ncbi:MAG: hydrogenase maturation nickel metallochaperone HypA [Spirochaetia bacterium]